MIRAFSPSTQALVRAACSGDATGNFVVLGTVSSADVSFRRLADAGSKALRLPLGLSINLSSEVQTGGLVVLFSREEGEGGALASTPYRGNIARIKWLPDLAAEVSTTGPTNSQLQRENNELRQQLAQAAAPKVRDGKTPRQLIGTGMWNLRKR